MSAPAPGRASDHLSIEDAANELGVHYMTAYRYVRSGRLHATRISGRWRIEPDEPSRFRADVQQRRSRRASSSGPGVQIGDRVDLVADAMLAGDAAGVWRCVQDSLNNGYDPRDIYLGLIAGALKIIGDGWESGEVSICDEHRASVIAMRTIGVLGNHYRRPGRTRGSVVLAAAPGDDHGLPTAIVADLLRLSGFNVTDLGADAPAGQLALAASREDRLRAVGVCATTSLDRHSKLELREALDLTRKAVDCPILVGGAAITSVDHALGLGADLSFESTEQLLSWFAEPGSTRSPGQDPTLLAVP